MSEWNKLTLKDAVLKANTGADAITRAPIVNYDSGIRCIRIQDISNEHIFDRWGFCEVSEENYRKFSLKQGDILIARTGNTIGVNRYIFSDLPAVFNNGLIRLKTNKEICVSKYIYYLFQTQNFRGHINSIAYGTSTQPNMQIESLLRFTFDCPPIQTQEKIVALFSVLDRKIENLRRQNETLERIAQTLFQHWFVDFEFPNADGKPYKSSGGEMMPSELGEIPVGWRVGRLGEIYKTTSGGTPSRQESEYYAEEGIPWVKSKELYSTFVLDTEEKITPLGLKRSSAKLLPEKTILIAMYGATVGQVSILGTESTCNQAICAVLEQDYSNHFIYLWLKHTQQAWTGMAIGSAQQNLSQVLISKIDMVIPTLDINFQFKDIVSPIFQKMLIHSRQIQTLTKTRDVLLPKLMSGKLRITE